LEQRMPGHPGAEYLPELRQLAERAQPMALGPVLQLDARAPDAAAAQAWLQRQLQRQSTRALSASG
ncbi:hypothetical protein, partial [Streptococcus oralis]